MAVACGGPAGPSTVDIDGVVLNSEGQPDVGAIVFLNDDPDRAVTTGVDGTFRFPAVKAPYTLGVNGGVAVKSYRGLTLPHPVLTRSLILRQAYATGRVTGFPTPLAAGDEVWVRGSGLAFQTSASSTDGTFGLGAAWSAAPAITTTLVAVHLRPDPGLSSRILQFYGFGQRPAATLTHGDSLSGLDITIGSPVATSSTTLSVSAGAYASPSVTFASFRVGAANFSIPLGVSGSLGDGDVMLIPSAGANFRAFAYAPSGHVYSNVRATPGGVTALHLPDELPLAPLTSGPGPAEAGGRPTLAWQAVSGATAYYVEVHGSGYGEAFYLPAGTTTLTLPDHGFVGSHLTGGGRYTWSVTAYAGSDVTPGWWLDAASEERNLGFDHRPATIFTETSGAFTIAP